MAWAFHGGGCCSLCLQDGPSLYFLLRPLSQAWDFPSKARIESEVGGLNPDF